MKDLRNEFYKIGFSNNPAYREKTLQAEQPAILLVDKWEGTTADEKTLHKKFSRVRIRGEWFSLTKENVSEIYRYFCDKSKSHTGNLMEHLKFENARLERELHYEKMNVRSFKYRAEMAENEIKRLKLEPNNPTPKTVFTIPDDLNEGEVKPSTSRLLESTKLSRLPPVSSRYNFAVKQEVPFPVGVTMPGVKPRDANYDIRRPVPGIVLRFNTDNPDLTPKVYTDSVPF